MLECCGPSALTREGHIIVVVFVFFFKQKTAYEVMPSLVGSEMDIEERNNGPPPPKKKKSGGGDYA